jgi:hypothetical protein
MPATTLALAASNTRVGNCSDCSKARRSVGRFDSDDDLSFTREDAETRLPSDRIVPRHGAHLEVMRALRHQQVDQSLTLQLQRKRAIELERGSQQQHRAHRFAQQLLNGGRIVLVFSQALPCGRHAHRVAADRMPFQDEATDEIGL